MVKVVVVEVAHVVVRLQLGGQLFEDGVHVDVILGGHLDEVQHAVRFAQCDPLVVLDGPFGLEVALGG